MRDRLNVSVMILTKNLQLHLPGCLASVSWCDDIHVYDSGSTDNTIQIAEAAGARVTQRTYPASSAPFGGDEAAHRTWALRNIPFKHEWLLLLDADERVTSHLENAMRRRLPEQPDCAAFRFCRRDFFLGRWIKHVTPPHSTSDSSGQKRCVMNG